jgi:hypothetical protein
MIRSYCTTQSVIALSSGEAEFYGIVKGSSVILGARAMAQDWGMRVTCRVHVDASAGIAISSRKGLGKVKHIHTNFLWVQSKVSSIEIMLKKVPTSENIADMLPKHLDEKRIVKLMTSMGCYKISGQSRLALKA